MNKKLITTIALGLTFTQLSVGAVVGVEPVKDKMTITAKPIMAENKILPSKNIFIEGKDISKKYYNKNSEKMLPLRAITENLGYTVKWNNEQKKVSILKGKKESLGLALKENKNLEIKNSSTFVNLSFLKNKLNLDVNVRSNGEISISNKELPVIKGIVSEIAETGFLLKGEKLNNKHLNELFVRYDDETKFVNIKREDININSKLMVYYGPATTRSIPAQSVAKKIVKISEDDVKYPVKEGKISNIRETKNGYQILIGDMQKGILLNISEKTKIFNSNNKEIDIEKLEKNMKIKAYHSNIMTMSLPPITSAIKIIVK